MVGWSTISLRSLSPQSTNVCHCAGALAFALICLAATTSRAQQVANVIVAPGNAAVTGFSGAFPPVQIAPGTDPGATTFIDLHGPSLRVVDLQHMGGPPTAQLVGAPKPFTFSAAQIGQVFGVALDDDATPNIYVAATSAYGLPIVVSGADRQLHHVKAGAADAAFMPGLWGPQGGPGSIWKVDGVTGKVTLFANIENGGRSNSGAALGALAFDPNSKSLFASDRESGFVYRLALDGRILDRYDHGVSGRQAQGLPAVPWNSQPSIDIAKPQFDSTDPATWNYAAPERRIFGLAVFRHRLYYAVADGLQIWSVGLNADGSFGSDAAIELAVPPSSGPTEISTITFDEQGRMFLAERAAPAGDFDLEALAVPAIGRVLRYAQVGGTSDGHRIWREAPDEYAIGFPHDFRNGNGGIAIGYNYDHKGEIIRSSCGGFMWSTGEDLRDTSDAALATQLGQSGPLPIAGLQGNGTWRVERQHEAPLDSYFVNYGDEATDEASRGYMGGIVIARPCTPRGQTFSPLPPTGAGQIAHGGRFPGRIVPPGTPPGSPPVTPPQIPGPPPGGCPPGQVRNVTTESCGSCPRPNIQINGKCCSVGTLAANAACSNSSCPSGQTPIGPSNFCCNSNQVYTNASGGPACCSSPLVNGQCPPPPPPTSTCPVGYVSAGGTCCLASQLTSTGTCCPPGQIPSGPSKSQCLPYIPVHFPPRCCPTGQIPVSGPKACCPTANVTTNGMCCPGSVDPNNRAQCRRFVPLVPACASGYTRMPDGSCCNNRFVSADRTSCNIPRRACAPGEFRDLRGVCEPMPSPACPPGEVSARDGHCVSAKPSSCAPGEVRRDGRCVREAPTCPSGERLLHGRCVPSRQTSCPPGQLRRRGRCLPPAPRACAPGEVRNRRGLCVRIGPSPRRPGGFGRFGPGPGLRPGRPIGPPPGPRIFR